MSITSDYKVTLDEVVAGKANYKVIFIDADFFDSTEESDFTAINGLEIIIIASQSQTAQKAYEMGATDFLLKPLKLDRFLRAVTKLNKQIAYSNLSHADKIFFIKGPRKGMLQRISLCQLLYVESALNHCYLYLEGMSKQIVYLNLTEMAAMLVGSDFIRIHRSYIVNVKKIERIDGNELFISGSKSSITVGVQYKAKFQLIIRPWILEASENKSKNKNSSNVDSPLIR